MVFISDREEILLFRLIRYDLLHKLEFIFKKGVEAVVYISDKQRREKNKKKCNRL